MFKKFKINSSNKFIVGVFGANGNVGRATIAALSYYFSTTISIRAIVRNPSAAKDLANYKNVHLVAGEIGKTDCAQSLNDLTCIFIIPPPVEDRIERMKVTLKLAKECKIEHIITISVTIADDLSTQFGKEFSELENFIKNLGVSFTILRLPFFADNFWIIKSSLPKIQLTLEKDKYFTPVLIADIGVAVSFVMAKYSQHTNKCYVITSDRINIEMLIEYLTEILQMSITYEKINFDESKAFMIQNGIESWQINATAELSKLINEGNSCLDNQQNDFKLITNQEPTKIKDWVLNAKEYFLSGNTVESRYNDTYRD